MNMVGQQYNNLLSIIKNYIDFDKDAGRELAYEDIAKYIDRVEQFTSTKFDEEIRKQFVVDIEYQYKIKHTSGHVIFDDYDDPRNWYTNNVPVDQYYWGKYRSYLINHTSISPESINLLDEETLPNIMNCLGNPNEIFDGKQLKRGLVIGDVQSGKTATYSGLICKAADAGYKVVILLAGISEDLRRQTQGRIDEGIVGVTWIQDGKTGGNVRVGVGKDNKEIKATSYTSTAADFTGNYDKIASSLNSHNSLVLFVVKKNVSVLIKLKKWLHDNNMDAVKGYINQPMLLIDDEADNASLNTKKDETDPTKTNRLIREICNLFKNATYVGFTATPFANVFIDPDSVDRMNNSDLFPEHFIYTLPTPSNYIGAQRIFYEDGDCYGCLRYITDIEDYDYSSEEYKEARDNDIGALNEGPFYYRHTKEWHGNSPYSMQEAIYCFFIANVIRDLRGDIATPRSMLINMSRFVKVQRYIKETVEDIYKNFFNTVRYDFSNEAVNNKSLPLYIELERLWNKHFLRIEATGITFSRIIKKEALVNAVDKMKIVVVNGSKAGTKLDYNKNKSLRVIAVGGLALSRGLTLEGLLVSYFYRNTATFDVLMQMGRWFGYRPKYGDLFEIWIGELSADWYAEISKASEELKADVKSMYEDRLTPKDFGLKVRDFSDELQITAPNKMRNSFDLRMKFSYYGDICDTPYISRNIEHNTSNTEQIRKFCQSLLEQGFSFDLALSDINTLNTSRIVRNVPKNQIVEFLKDIYCSVVNVNFDVKQILDFISDSGSIGLENWDVVFQGGKSESRYPIEGLTDVHCVNRAIYFAHNRVIQLSSRRRLLGTYEGKFGLSPEQIQIAEEKQRKEWRKEEGSCDYSKRDIPLKAYFRHLPDRTPLLIIVMVEPNPPKRDEDGKEENKHVTEFRKELGDDKIVAFAIGFPGIESSEETKHYRINTVYQQLMFADEEEEIDDEE